jgi:beta-phosphoglucomutase-like phosphatase (HAD superfamily)
MRSLKSILSQHSLGVIFDFDGVIVDSEKHWAIIENSYLHKHIPNWADEAYSTLVGKDLSSVYDLLIRSWGFKLSKQQYLTTTKLWRRYYIVILPSLLPMFERY